MSIVVSSKASSTEASKASEPGAGKKNGSGAAQSADGTKSFLSIFGALEDAAANVVPDAAEAVLAVVDRLEKLRVHGGEGLVDPALLLAQAPLPSASVVTPEGPAKPLGKGRALHPGSLSAVGGAASGAVNGGLDSAKTGQAALDGLTGGKFALSDATSGQSANAGASGHEAAKEVLPEKVVKFIQELVASMAKTPEPGAVALGAGRDRNQESQPLVAKAGSDEPFVAVANQQGAGGAMGVDGVVATADGAALDSEFSEQVNYWIGQDIQKAEMTLDGLGLNPVEVSISMQGNEAQVIFRTDESQAREALANATEQLQEALSRQGVALSSVSVGTSDSGGAQQRQQGEGQRSGWKVGVVDAAELAPTAQPLRSSGPGRTVDLYV